MALQHLIAHRIYKSAPTTPCEVRLRQNEIRRDGKSEELCRELKNTYIRKGGKAYGAFSDDSGSAPLSAWLKEWLEERITFLSLAQKITTHLQLHIDKSDTPLDNTLLIFYERIEAGDGLYIVLLDHSSGQYFDGEMELCDSRYLDTQSIHLAAKIKTAEFLSGANHSYLSILKWRGEKELSDAFAEAMGFSNKVDTGADTSEFLDLVTHYTATLPEDVAKETRRTAVEFCLQQDKVGLPVQMDELAEHISVPEQPHFAHFARTTQPEIKTEWIPDKAQLKNYVRISGRDEQMSMSFASACLGDTVVYDTNSDSLIIKNIPASLKAKLMEHLKKS
ncbi:MAG: nucleoid-associated protein [Cellvibrionaceae bacterium]|nr:nucleoid-associated protein [Cellvibrionaceae bacterium]